MSRDHANLCTLKFYRKWWRLKRKGRHHLHLHRVLTKRATGKMCLKHLLLNCGDDDGTVVQQMPKYTKDSIPVWYFSWSVSSKPKRMTPKLANRYQERWHSGSKLIHQSWVWTPIKLITRVKQKKPNGTPKNASKMDAIINMPKAMGSNLSAMKMVLWPKLWSNYDPRQ